MNRARLARALAQARLALMLLTRLPAGRLPEPAPAIGASVWAFPLAGLAVGGLAALILAAALALHLPPALAAGLALAAQVALTGALHEDGLADLADGLWGGRSPERRLEIMRDSRIGSYGAVALILSLGLRWQALAVLAANPLAPLALIALAMTSRVAPALLLATLPPARAEGMGASATGAPIPRALAAAALALAPVLALTPALPAAPLMVLVQALLTLGLARLALARLGGQTGDVLGASQQLAEIGGALALVAALAR